MTNALDSKAVQWFESWMDDQEIAIARAFYEELGEYLPKSDAPHSPLLALRIQDVLVSYLITRRLELQLLRQCQNPQKPSTPSQPLPVPQQSPDPQLPTKGNPSPDSPKPRGTTDAVSDSLFKARERLRKAVSELEDRLAKTALTAPAPNLAMLLKPIIQDHQRRAKAPSSDPPPSPVSPVSSTLPEHPQSKLKPEI